VPVAGVDELKKTACSGCEYRLPYSPLPCSLPFRKFCSSFRKFRPQDPDHVVMFALAERERR